MSDRHPGSQEPDRSEDLHLPSREDPRRARQLGPPALHGRVKPTSTRRRTRPSTICDVVLFLASAGRRGRRPGHGHHQPQVQRPPQGRDRPVRLPGDLGGPRSLPGPRRGRRGLGPGEGDDPDHRPLRLFRPGPRGLDHRGVRDTGRRSRPITIIEWLPKFIEEMGYGKDIDYFVYKIPVPKELPEFYIKIFERIKRRGSYDAPRVHEAQGAQARGSVPSSSS